MLEWIAESNAHPVGDMRLFRLPRELSGVEQWITSAKKIDNVIEYFLGAEPKEFWSTLVYSKKLVELLESCLDFYIRTSYFNELDFYMGLKGGDVHTLFLRIYQRLFLVFLRVLANLKDEGIHDGIFSHLLYANKIITIDILVKLCSVYGSENQTILSTLMNKLFVIQVGFKRDLDNFISSASQMLEKSRKQIAQLVGDVENNQVPRSVGHTDQLLRTIDNVSNLFLSMSSFVEVYQPRQPWKSLYSSIPNFIDSISKSLTDENIMNLAASTLSVPFANFLACKRARINQSGVHLFKTFYRLKAFSEKDRFRLIYNNLSNREFLVRLDDDIRIKEELFKFVKSKVCTKDHEKHVVKALDEAYYEKAISVKTALMQRQILQDIGKLKDAQIESAVKSLEDLLPEFSREQLHLCLRHFDYDLEKTTNAIMEMKDGLPFELRILMKCKDRFDDLTPARVLIQQFWDSGETDSNALCEKLNQPEKISSLFNLKPIPAKKMVNDENVTKIKSESQRSKKLEKLMMKYDGLFDMSGVQTAISSINKAKKTDVSKVEAFEVDGKLLVKQSAVQRQLLQPGATADEKAAIRESYNRYQYELSEDDDEDGRHDLDARFAEEVGMSGRFNQQKKKPVVAAQTTAALDDDEYDDTYDDPRTFAAELVGSEGEDEKQASKPSGSRQQNVETGKYNQPAVSANLPKAWTNTANRQNQPHASSRGGGTAGTSSPRGGNVSAAPGNVNRQTASNNPPPSQSSSTNYTGGRSRQVKERNKGKMQQRGADKKARGGMF